jgi:hypothetical protein
LFLLVYPAHQRLMRFATSVLANRQPVLFGPESVALVHHSSCGSVFFVQSTARVISCSTSASRCWITLHTSRLWIASVVSRHHLISSCAQPRSLAHNVRILASSRSPLCYIVTPRASRCPSYIVLPPPQLLLVLLRLLGGSSRVRFASPFKADCLQLSDSTCHHCVIATGFCFC